MSVKETFFSVDVENMERAIAFYVDALGAEVVFQSPAWTSLRIAGVRVALALGAERAGSRIGLHFSVSDLASARSAVEHAGGLLASTPIEVAPGLMIALASDTEGNTFTLAATSTADSSS